MPARKSERLTDRQRNILKFIEKHVLNNGYPPTIREIGEATGIASTSVVNYNLNKLTRLGYLNRTSTKSRGIKLTEKNNGRPVHVNPMTVNVRYLGQIVAGQPMPIPDDSDFATDENSLVEVAPSMIGNADPAEVFALRVKGDSMIDAMIQDGDIVILRPVDSVRNGDMVAVYLHDTRETTLKHYYTEKDNMIRLQPAHPTMEPIYVHASRCQVQGRVLSVLRMLR